MSSYLIDASVYIFRYYFALPPNWESRSGYSTEAVYGFTNFLLDMLARDPRHIACAFDESLGSCFRNELYPDYKCSRAMPDEALAFQLAACREMAEALGIASFSSGRYEADDILATLTRKLRRHKPIVVSRDKDLGQLLDRGASSLWDFAADRHMDSEALEQKFGVKPAQIADYLALVGDSSDDIPGIPGVGPKTAARLLEAFEGIEMLLVQLEQVASLPIRGAKGIAQRLQEFEEQLRLAKRLTSLEENIPLGIAVADLRPQVVDLDLAQALAEEFGIGGLKGKMVRTVSRMDGELA
ncbi:5'-3' exonuclease H3TH domain-containing protein [Microbulbifer sp. MLAF003]|uniref:5'-3' exonuclease n=1 Tax=Microbulbifer sp. MLAF003 TaxID=3032582 RepID=UPI0024ACB5BF|nr:5'-3' exonuclease H3TH domain-containing protein [Microbulbifer sp. MLAF003]WHI49906.1 5'-3' exonuclease H3TH domain-containing protein [Microbulbifer sp. MLAF003]